MTLATASCDGEDPSSSLLHAAPHTNITRPDGATFNVAPLNGTGLNGSGLNGSGLNGSESITPDAVIPPPFPPPFRPRVDPEPDDTDGQNDTGW